MCFCPPGYTGDDCSTPICGEYENPFCGVSGSFALNPRLALDTQSIFDNTGAFCDLQTIILNYDRYLSNLGGSSTDSCAIAVGKAYCQRLFVPCDSNGAIREPCPDDCENTLAPCDCNTGRDTNIVCNSLESSYPNDPRYFDSIPHTDQCHITTGPISTGALSTGALTTGELTTGALTTGALTTGALTTGQITTGALTTGALTTGALTTGAITTGAITTRAITTGPITTRAATTRAATTRALTTVGLTTGSVESICSHYSFTGQSGYFCNPQHNGFYYCLHGELSSQSTFMVCPEGTSCSCAEGVECSNNRHQSPCR